MNIKEEVGPEFQQLLEKAGWFPARSIVVDNWIEKLEIEGYPRSVRAKSILESIGGLQVVFPAKGPNPYAHVTLFDPFTAAAGEFKDVAKPWMDQLNLNLFPLGLDLNLDNAVLWLGSDGKIYSGYAYGLHLWGNSFKETMERRAMGTLGSKVVAV